MFKPRRENHAGGKSFGSKFGGPKSRPSFGGGDSRPRDFHRGGDERPESFDAICASCGKECRVPFKPNGRKPVYCLNCFKKDGDDKPSYGDKPTSREPRSFSTGSSYDAKQVNEQLKLVQSKLDRILKLLDSDKLDIDHDIEKLG
jgi:CxxC-x17-CxxC domain-containing protein